jgi:hypothetical protein
MLVTLFVVVCGLKQCGAFAAVHRSVAKVKLAQLALVAAEGNNCVVTTETE